MDDLFGNSEPATRPRTLSQADIEKQGRVSYHRRARNGKPANCDDCIDIHIQQGGTPLHPATYIRSHGGEKRALCYQHKQERQDNERLGRG